MWRQWSVSICSPCRIVTNSTDQSTIAWFCQGERWKTRRQPTRQVAAISASQEKPPSQP